MDQELKEMIVERLFLDLDPAEIDSDTALVDYGIDSFLLLELIVGIEETYHVRFEQTDITSETLKSINTLKELIVGKQQADG